METGYRAIASLLKLDVHSEQHGVFFAVKQFLESDKSQPWLLILDEVDDKETVTAPASNGRKPMDYIPRSAKGQVLITTRDSRLVGLMDGHVVPAQNGIRIGPMPFEESLSLFLRCMRQELVHEATQEQYREFLDMLGGLPLALVQAASYMREEEATIEEFTSLYRDVEKHEDLFHESAITTDLEQRSVLCTWEISYARIAGPSYPDSKSQAAVVLDLLGFLDAQATSTRSLSEYEARFRGTRKMDAIRGLKHLLPIQESPSSLLSDVYESRFQNHNMFRATIGRLRNYSLVTSRECWVHPVVHSWIYRRLCLQERCKYISWMVEELLKHTRAPDLTSWEAILVPQYCVFKEMHYLRHAKVVLGYALSSRMTDYMTDHRISIPGFEELLYRIAEISASTGEAAKAIEYFEKSIRAAERSGSWGTLLDERRVRLAKVRSGEQSLAQDIAEAQFCLQAAPNCFDAKLWLAQCLNMSGERIQAIKLYEELMSLPQLDYQDLGNNKSLLIALCDVASIRAQTRTEENMTLARQSIDGIILPYISPIPQGNTVKAFLYPDILFTRMEVASSESDLRRVCRMMADYAYDERLGPPLIGGDPEELLPGIDKLWERGRWLEIEEFVGIYEESRWSITQIMAYNIEEPFNSELVSRTVLHWCELYNIQGKACFEQGKYAKAEEAHMKALGLHLYLHSEGSSSPEFRRNIYDLAGALAIQGQSKQKELDTIRRSFQDILAQMEPTQHSGTSHGRPKKRDFQEFSDEAG
jgi:tetratricopeptide (TPR) repeat protein